ncbi:MAG: LysR family transcriptional regulator [Clostridiales bacterium]|nr:LysR family transcriptional regulator [Clostridiales bacterium]
MNTQRIRIILTAIDCGSLTKAGQQLGYTQSYLTQIVKAFEEEAGFPVLVKTNRGVEPTNEAKMLIPAMRQLISSEEKLEQEMAEIQGLHRGTIRIGTFVSTSVFWVPQILEYFQNNYPEVVFRIEELGHDEMIRGLTDGSIDIALMSDPEGKGNIEFIPVLEDPMLLALPARHDLTRFDSVPAEELKDYPFIMTYKSYDKDPHNVLERAGFTPEVKYYSRDDFAVLSMVQRGLGLAILPEMTIREFPGEYETRVLEPKAYRTLGIGIKSREDAGPLTRFVIKFIRERIKKAIPEETTRR